MSERIYFDKSYIYTVITIVGLQVLNICSAFIYIFAEYRSVLALPSVRSLALAYCDGVSEQVVLVYSQRETVNAVTAHNGLEGE